MTATIDAPALTTAPGPARRHAAWRSPAAVVSAAVLLLFAVAALAPWLLAPGDPEAIDLGATLAPPSPEHWLGTDEIGRDLYTRVVHGTGQSLLIGLGAAAVSLATAALLASASALSGPSRLGRLVAAATNRLIEVIFAFPTLLLALLLVAVLGPSAQTLIVAVGLGTAPGYARMIRAQLFTVRDSGYVEAATTLGHSRARILRAHILPNALRPLIAVFTMSIGQSIVWSSSLAFLGLGVAPPAAEWGALLEAGRTYLTQAWWLVVLPGLAIVILAVAATILGRHIQTQLENGD